MFQETEPGSPDFDGITDDDLTVALGGLHDVHASTTRHMLAVIGEYDRRQAWRQDGAFSMAAWLVRAMGMSWNTAHTWIKIARRLEELPEIAKAFMAGELSFDQVRVGT